MSLHHNVDGMTIDSTEKSITNNDYCSYDFLNDCCTIKDKYDMYTYLIVHTWFSLLTNDGASEKKSHG